MKHSKLGAIQQHAAMKRRKLGATQHHAATPQNKLGATQQQQDWCSTAAASLM
jgi:hypothetical protein